MTTARDVIREDVETCRALIDQGGSGDDERAALRALERVESALEEAWGEKSTSRTAAPSDRRPTILACLSTIETMLRDRPCSRSPRCLDVEYKRLRTRSNKKDPHKPLLPDPDRLCSECSAYVLVQRAQEKIIESQHDESMDEQDEERRAERASRADQSRSDEDGGL